MTCTRALVTLDMLSFWLEILALGQYAEPIERLLRLTVGVKIWIDSG